MQSIKLFLQRFVLPWPWAVAIAVAAGALIPFMLEAQCQAGDLGFGLVEASSREPVSCFEADTEYRVLVWGPGLASYPICLNEGPSYTLIGPTSGGQQCLGSAAGDQIFRIETLPFIGGASTLIGFGSCPGGASAVSIPACNTLPNEPTCVDPHTGLVAWYPFDESFGDTVFEDLVSNVDAATAEGFPIGTVGKVTSSFTGALQFDGVDDLVTVPHRNDFKMGFGPFTVETWIKTTDTEGAIVGKRRPLANGNLRDWLLMIHQGELWFRFNTRNVSVATNVTDGRWHHVAVVFDGTDPMASGLFVDGQRLHTFDATVMSSPLDFTYPLQIGGLLNAEPTIGRQFFDGKIDELSIYRAALSDAAILVLAQAGHLGKCKDLPPPPSVALTCTPTVNSPNIYDCEASVFGGQPLFSFDWDKDGAGTVTDSGAEAVVDARDTCENLDGILDVTVTVTDALGGTAEASRRFRCELGLGNV